MVNNSSASAAMADRDVSKAEKIYEVTKESPNFRGWIRIPSDTKQRQTDRQTDR